jgi:hypothetical protein
VIIFPYGNLSSTSNSGVVPVVQDAIAGFQAAPVWAQIGMVFFAFTVVVFMVEPSIRRWKCRGQFDAIAGGLEQPRPAGRGLPAMFSITIDGRAFEVRHDLRSSSRGSSYRGPSGFLLITATRLASDRWAMHQVDMSVLNKRLAWLVSSKRLTGDAEFDARYLVVEDGLPVRETWLDAETRAAIARFLDAAPIPGLIWIRERELQFIMQTPWTGVDGPVMRALLERQGALASALDRSAR